MRPESQITVGEQFQKGSRIVVASRVYWLEHRQIQHWMVVVRTVGKTYYQTWAQSVFLQMFRRCGEQDEMIKQNQHKYQMKRDSFILQRANERRARRQGRLRENKERKAKGE